MLLNNAKTLLSGVSIKNWTATNGDRRSSLSGTNVFKAYTSPGNYSNTNSATHGSDSYLNSVGVVIGKDTAPPQKTDYQMTEPITEGYSTSSSLIKNDGTIGATSAITNTSEENITINSVGLFSNPGTTSTYQMLLSKTLLDTPLVIKPTETKTITITINLDKMIDDTQEV